MALREPPASEIVPFPSNGDAHWYVAEPTPNTGAPLTIIAPVNGAAHYAIRLDRWGDHQPVVMLFTWRGRVSAL